MNIIPQVLYDFIIHGREHVSASEMPYIVLGRALNSTHSLTPREHVVNADVDAVSVYCVLALYIPPHIIKLASMVYVYLKNRDPTDFGMGSHDCLMD